MELTDKEIKQLYNRASSGENLKSILLTEFSDRIFFEQEDKDGDLTTYRGIFLKRARAEKAITDNQSPFSQDKSYIYQHKIAEIESNESLSHDLCHTIKLDGSWLITYGPKNL
jgi:hypothetical protein